MATSSITKSFVIEGKEQVEKFVAALEWSEKNRPEPSTVDAKFVKSDEELIEFLENRDIGKTMQALCGELEKGVQGLKNGEVYTIEEAWREIDRI